MNEWNEKKKPSKKYKLCARVSCHREKKDIQMCGDKKN